jgi:hypothetical protein
MNMLSKNIIRISNFNDQEGCLECLAVRALLDSIGFGKLGVKDYIGQQTGIGLGDLVIM